MNIEDAIYFKPGSKSRDNHTNRESENLLPWTKHFCCMSSTYKVVKYEFN